MHDFLFLPRSHKEVEPKRLPGPRVSCAGCCRGSLYEPYMSRIVHRNRSRAMARLSVTCPTPILCTLYSVFCVPSSSMLYALCSILCTLYCTLYAIVPFRPTRTTTFFVLLWNRVQLARIRRPTRHVAPGLATHENWVPSFSVTQCVTN